jgi:hypothetical protein
VRCRAAVAAAVLIAALAVAPGSVTAQRAGLALPKEPCPLERLGITGHVGAAAFSIALEGQESVSLTRQSDRTTHASIGGRLRVGGVAAAGEKLEATLLSSPMGKPGDKAYASAGAGAELGFELDTAWPSVALATKFLVDPFISRSELAKGKVSRLTGTAGVYLTAEAGAGVGFGVGGSVDISADVIGTAWFDEQGTLARFDGGQRISGEVAADLLGLSGKAKAAVSFGTSEPPGRILPDELWITTEVATATGGDLIDVLGAGGVVAPKSLTQFLRSLTLDIAGGWHLEIRYRAPASAAGPLAKALGTSAKQVVAEFAEGRLPLVGDAAAPLAAWLETYATAQVELSSTTEATAAVEVKAGDVVAFEVDAGFTAANEVLQDAWTVPAGGERIAREGCPVPATATLLRELAAQLRGGGKRDVSPEIEAVLAAWQEPVPEPVGSGCSPGPGPLPDGVWFGFVHADPAHPASSVQFDLACYYSSTRWIALGHPPDETPEDNIVNTSTALRRLVTGPGFRYWRFGGVDGLPGQPCSRTEPTSTNEGMYCLAKGIPTSSAEVPAELGVPVLVRTHDGKAVEILQRFLS